jgi:hypothetical protein
VDRAGFLMQTATEPDPGADISSDLLIDLALRRRALAADIAGLSTYETFHLWSEVMKAAFLSDPPPGYARVSIAQLRSADEEVFRIVAEKCREGTNKAPGEAKTRFEKAFKEAIFDFNVRLRLAPLPRGSGASSSAAATSSRPPKDHSRELADLRAQVQNLKRKNQQPDTAKRSGGGSGSKRSGGGGGGDNRNQQKQSMPKALKGKNARTATGDPICFNYNIKGCPDAPPGGRCSRGVHVCAQPGCTAAHGLQGNH